MKKIILVVLFFVQTLAVSAGSKTALVIGNSNYESIPLANPVNDAVDIAKKLKSLGFEVIHKDNLTRKQMRNIIRKFGEKLKTKGGTGIFFYAGHGMQVSGKNYLIPIGADIQSEFEVPDESVEADLLLRALDDAKNPLNIVVLDACRDNPFSRSFRSTIKGLARMEGGTGTLIAYSTGPGNVAMDGQGRNSPYTKHLLKYMTQTGLSIEQVFKRVRVGVEEDSEGKQTPWETSSLRGDFYFVPESIQNTSIVKNQKHKKIKIEQKPVIEAKISEPIPARNNKPETNTNTLISNFNNPDKAAYKLTIYTNPEAAQVRFLNLKQTYQNGMELTPGDYNIEISRDGFISKKQWITIDQDHFELQVTLVPEDY